jgi:NADH:ubiquinone oxidoreductase subunit 6 (subunit J)
MLRDANAVTALHFSGAHVSGNWWRCLGILVWVALLITIPGLVIAFAFLAFTEPPVTQSVHTVNMLLYAGFLLPFAVISLTLLYGDLIWRRDAQQRSRKVRE